MLAFVLLASNETLHAAEVERARTEVRAALAFEPRFELTWVAATRCVAVLAWDLHPDGYPPGPRWHVDHTGISAFSGMPRRSGAAWATGSWATQLHTLCRSGRITPDTTGLWGVFSVVHLDPHGSGYVCADPLSIGSIYRARAGSTEVVSNRPDLAAVAAGVTADRDALGVGWFVVNDHILDDRTSYSAVRAVPADTALRVDRAGSVGAVRVTGLWDGEPPPYEQSRTSLVEDLTHHMAAIVDIDRPLRITLTGGRDSRLVLAVALHAGVAGRFEYVTFESFPGELDPDVEVATAICARYGLEHSVQRAGVRRERPADLDTLVRAHAGATAAMLPAKSVRPALLVNGRVQVGGGLGTVYTGPRAGDDFPADIEAVHRLIAGRFYGGDGAGLLKPDAKAHYLGEIRRLVEEQFAGGSSIEEVPYRFEVQHVLHGWTANELYLRDLVPNVQALYSPHALLAARAAGWLGRRSQRLHFDVMMRTAPELATVPFAQHGWPAILLDQLEAAERFRVAPIVGSTAPRGLRGLRWSEHVDVFAQYLLDEPSNPVHDLIDRSAVEDVLHGRVPMPPGGVAQLHNALGVAVWLGRHEVAPVRRTWSEVT